MNIRWYKSQLEGLPPDSRRRLTSQLRRSVRGGDLPSKRQWRTTVQNALGIYRPAAL